MKTIKTNQIWVNLPHMDGMGMGWTSWYVTDELANKYPQGWVERNGGLPCFYPISIITSFRRIIIFHQLKRMWTILGYLGRDIRWYHHHSPRSKEEWCCQTLGPRWIQPLHTPKNYWIIRKVVVKKCIILAELDSNSRKPWHSKVHRRKADTISVLETNIDPENETLENEISFWDSLFSRLCQFRWGYPSNIVLTFNVFKNMCHPPINHVHRNFWKAWNCLDAQVLWGGWRVSFITEAMKK